MTSHPHFPMPDANRGRDDELSWMDILRHGDLDVIRTGTREIALADYGRAKAVSDSIVEELNDPVVQQFARSPVEDELSPAELAEEVRAARQVLDEDEWIEAAEAKRRLLG